MIDEFEERSEIEVRSADTVLTSTQEYLEGLAVPYGEVTHFASNEKDGLNFKERIEVGAFDDWIRTNNVRFVASHEENREYGDTKSDTLKLTSTTKGIEFKNNIPPYASSLKRELDRDAFKGMSWRMKVLKQRWEDGIRVIEKAELHHISPVYNPAYKSTYIKKTNLADFHQKLREKIGR
jgi:HK97 family phage prohead protease